jgi:hypothetical protein
VPVQVLQPAYSAFYHTPLLLTHSRAYRRGAWGRSWSIQAPFYDPFWSSRMMYEAQLESHYRRELQVAIKSALDGRRLFDVTVHNLSDQMSTPVVMPALVQSAFEGFPGPSGVARRVEMTQTAQLQPTRQPVAQEK